MEKQVYKHLPNIDYSNEVFKKHNYIPTERMVDLLNKLYINISKGISIIIVGDIATSKSFSAEMICRYIYEQKRKKDNSNKEMYIKYCLNRENKISDLIKKLVLDKNYFSGIKIIDGPLLKAFKNGIPLILEGINLANESILQYIGVALDTKMINIEIPYIGMVTQEMKEGFSLIGIIENTYSLINLNYTYFSRFIRIEFPPFNQNELLDISLNILKYSKKHRYLYEENYMFIKDLIDFHMNISKSDGAIIMNSFTIRDIITCIKAYIKNKNPYEIIKLIYGGKSSINIEENILKYQSFKKPDYFNKKCILDYIEFNNISKEIYRNPEINEALESALYSLNLERNILLLGDEGAGKSKIARWIAQIFNISNNKKKNDFYYYICTAETEYSDLIGAHYLYLKNNKKYFEWRNGFLTNAMENEKLVILDNLEELNSSVLERLKNILELQFKDNKSHTNFRLILVCNKNKVYKLSNNFVDKIMIIKIGEQLKDITIDTYENLNNLIKILFLQNEQDEKDDNSFLDDTKNDDNSFLDDIEKDNNSFLDDADDINNSSFEKSDSVNEDYDDREEEFFNSNKFGIKKEKIDKFKEIKNDIISYLVKFLHKLIINSNENKSSNSNYSNINFGYSKPKTQQLSIKDISRICYSLNMILKIEEFQRVKVDKLVEFIFSLLFNKYEDLIKIDEEIKKIILKLFHDKYSSIFLDYRQILDIPDFVNFISIFYASFLINLHVCIVVPDGVGKSLILEFIQKTLLNKNKYILSLFNLNFRKRFENIYGEAYLNTEKLEKSLNPFIKSIKEGKIFITDEINISNENSSSSSSLLPFIDFTLKKNNIFIPIINKSFNIHKKFFLIDLGTETKEEFPYFINKNITKKIKILKYPCSTDILYLNDNKFLYLYNEKEKLICFMNKFNEMINKYNLDVIPLSFRDIHKILERIVYNKEYSHIQNLNNFHIIYFYIFSSINKPLLSKTFNYNDKMNSLKMIIHEIFVSIFNLDKETSEELLNCYFSKPDFEIYNNYNYYIIKNKLKLKIYKDYYDYEEKQQIFYNDYFKLKMIPFNEQILLVGGESKYKIDLICGYYFENINLVTNIDHLFGSSNN